MSIMIDHVMCVTRRENLSHLGTAVAREDAPASYGLGVVTLLCRRK